MRVVVAILALFLAGCSSGSESTDSTDASSDVESTADAVTSESATGDGTDACTILSPDDLERLSGHPANEPQRGNTGGLPNCQWEADGGGYVQAVAAAAPDWALSLPDLLRTLESSGQFDDSENLRKLQEGRDLIEAGEALSPTEACALFSQMLELQGQPAGSSRIVNLVPNQQSPQAVAGQTCSSGRFTSVMVANPAGLQEPYPTDEVAQALMAAHEASLHQP